MDARAPEVGVLEIFVGAVAEQALDVLADEGRRIVAACLEAVDDRGRAFEKQCEAGLQGISASSAFFRAVMSLHEPTISSGSPFSSRITCCSSLTQR